MINKLYLFHSMQVLGQQTAVTATEREPSKLVSCEEKVKPTEEDILSGFQLLQPVENKRELMRQLSARYDGQISNFPLKETAGRPTDAIFLSVCFL